MFVLLLAACTPPSGELRDEDGDGVQAKYDCDDGDAAIFPGADELCDGIDNDCDDKIDNINGEESSTPASAYIDEDGDGYGGATTVYDACNPTATVSEGGDCDDNSDLIYPGAPEVCDGVDNDCDNAVDDDDGDVDLTTAVAWYADTDEDGYGNPLDKILSCAEPAGRTEDYNDCDDTDGAIHPGAAEVCDGADNDCDDLDDEADPDVDLSTGTDGWLDDDADGYGDPAAYAWACALPSTYVGNDEDCDDADAEVSPAAQEVCDDADNDCDTFVDDGDPDVDLSTGLWVYADADTDGWGDDTTERQACAALPGETTLPGDCDDGRATISPSALELCDGVDNDCDGASDDDDPSVSATTPAWPDADGDGYGDATAGTVVCTLDAGQVENGADCDDADATISPVATEVCGGEDEDCDGLVDDADTSLDTTLAPTWAVDADGDGHGGTSMVAACEMPVGTTEASTDCDDGDNSVSPDASETCDDRVDQDCDGEDRACTALDGREAASEVAYATRDGRALSMAYGASLAVLDWDGDGQEDLAVGASGSSDGASLAGGVYLHTRGVSGRMIYDEDDDAHFLGTSIGALAGSAIAAAPDLDGDGDQELFVLDGSDVEIGLVLGGTPSDTLRNARVWDQSCVDALDLGDQDGDGAAEWACAGGADGTLRIYTGLPSSPLATYSGTASGDYVGYHAAAGDLDGDGDLELFVGAPGINDGARTDVGGAFVLDGPWADTAINATSLDILGDTASATLGTQVMLADLDGDGLVDPLASAPYESFGGTNSGAWYGWYGRPTGVLGPDDAAWIAYGDAASEYVGRGRIDSADFDGDGRADLAFGSSTAAKNGTGSGVAWLLYGPHSGRVSAADADATFTGEAAYAAMGSDVRFAPDLTGDGQPELILGASGMTGLSGNRAGVVYLLGAE